MNRSMWSLGISETKELRDWWRSDWVKQYCCNSRRWSLLLPDIWAAWWSSRGWRRRWWWLRRWHNWWNWWSEEEEGGGGAVVEWMPKSRLCNCNWIAMFRNRNQNGKKEIRRRSRFQKRKWSEEKTEEE